MGRETYFHTREYQQNMTNPESKKFPVEALDAVVPMWIMVSGPYRSGSDDPRVWEENLGAMNAAALDVWKKGHVPVIGVNMALPVITAAGVELYDDIMMPLSLLLADRCDAVLRVGGFSAGADREVERFQARGLPVYRHIDEIPPAVTTS